MVNVENHNELLQFLLDQKLLSPRDKPLFENLHGGVSNRTVLVRHADGKGWVVKQALKKLRVREDWFSEPERIHHEAAGLRQLASLTCPDSIPDFIFEDRTHHILIMEAVPEPHVNYKTLLLKKPPGQKHVEDFANLLADIHLNSYRKRSQLSDIFYDTNFFENLRLDPYYSFSAKQLPAAAPFLHQLIENTRARSLTLVHGDYSPKNILIYKERLILLDHEVIHFGDPAFDVGFAMAHYLGKAHHCTSNRDAFYIAARLFWQTYFSRTDSAIWADKLEEYCTQHLLGCLMARAIGKSPLEYLDQKKREVQKISTLKLMQGQDQKMLLLINQFKEQLEQYE